MSEWTEEGARRTEGPADAGGMPAKKLEPHTEMWGKNKESGLIKPLIKCWVSTLATPSSSNVTKHLTLYLIGTLFESCQIYIYIETVISYLLNNATTVGLRTLIEKLYFRADVISYYLFVPGSTLIF